MNVVHGRISTAFFVIFAISMHTNSSYANDTISPRAQKMQQLFECRALSESEARLACFDTAAESLVLAEREGEIVVVERARVLESRRALFGFTLPDVSSLLGGQTEQLDEVETTLERASFVTGAGWTFYLADGSVWRQTDTLSLQFRAVSGLPIRIRRGAMGTYFLKVANNPAVRAKRQ